MTDLSVNDDVHGTFHDDVPRLPFVALTEHYNTRRVRNSIPVVKLHSSTIFRHLWYLCCSFGTEMRVLTPRKLVNIVIGAVRQVSQNSMINKYLSKIVCWVLFVQESRQSYTLTSGFTANSCNHLNYFIFTVVPPHECFRKRDILLTHLRASFSSNVNSGQFC